MGRGRAVIPKSITTKSNRLGYKGKVTILVDDLRMAGRLWNQRC